MKYNVFTDFHHAGLLRSLILLFEGRLGGNVYRPIGEKWYEKGYWKVFDNPHTIKQFLGIGANTPDGTPKLNEVVKARSVGFTTIDAVNGIYHCQDIDSGLTNKAITFDAFMSLPIDIVIASIPQHVEPFKKLCAEHPKKPKLIFQIGNSWTVEAGLAPNVMASAIINDVPENINFISYHQEFPLDIFYSNPPDYAHPGSYIASFINVFHKFPDYHLFLDAESSMPDWKFSVFGAQGRDGPLHGDKQVAQAMRDSMWIWHTKEGGDGYGHVVHNTGAVGRPMITKKSYYEGKFGADLMNDGVTCINIDGLGYNEIVKKIEYYSQPERYMNMCNAVVNNFKKVVDFDKEELALKDFLISLQ